MASTILATDLPEALCYKCTFRKALRRKSLRRGSGAACSHAARHHVRNRMAADAAMHLSLVKNKHFTPSFFWADATPLQVVLYPYNFMNIGKKGWKGREHQSQAIVWLGQLLGEVFARVTWQERLLFIGSLQQVKALSAKRSLFKSNYWYCFFRTHLRRSCLPWGGNNFVTYDKTAISQRTVLKQCTNKDFYGPWSFLSGKIPGLRSDPSSVLWIVTFSVLWIVKFNGNFRVRLLDTNQTCVIWIRVLRIRKVKREKKVTI